MQLFEVINPINSGDSNLFFLNRYTSPDTASVVKFEQKPIQLKEISLRIERIIGKLRGLTNLEQNEWVYVYENSCRELAGSRKSEHVKAFKEHAYILVKIANLLELTYRKDEVEGWIKKVYYAQYQEAIVQKFGDSGYDISIYATLKYQKSLIERICLCLDP